MPIHKDLPDSELHNPKGFDVANPDTVLTKSSTGFVEYIKKSEFGADILFGDGDPAGTVGVIDDIYIDRTDGDVFKKVDLTLWEFQFNISSAGGITDHGFLDAPSLLDDDHPQYLLVDGSRAMTGDLDLDGHDLLNVLNLNGIPTSFLGTHASRHLPGGADPLITAAPTSNLCGNSPNSEGSAQSFSRSDHTHEIDVGAPVSQTPGQSNSEGSAPQLARSDHIHNIPTSAPSPLAPDATNSEGTAPSFARSDHIHNVQTDAPTTNLNTNTTNQEGVGSSFARNDHSHAIDTGVPSVINPDVPNNAGTSPNLARADHIHNIPTAVPVGLSPNGGNNQGDANSFSRSNHTHNIPTAAPPANLSANTSNQDGVANSFSRSDHSHGVNTGVPSTQTPDQANATGTSPNLSRADHTHNIPTAVPISVGVANSQGSAASFARSDHVHNVFPPFQHQDAENNTPQTTTGGFTAGLTLTTPSIPAGRYRIAWYYEWAYDDTFTNYIGRVQLKNTTTLAEHNAEPSDSGGGGPGGTDQRFPVSGFAHVNLTAGVHFIDVDFGSSSGTTATLWRVRIEIRRVS